jgi:predicted RNA-binding protein with RPS1 domain
MGYKIGDIIEGQVTGIQPYGAFISLDAQTQGLVHISDTVFINKIEVSHQEEEK